MQHSSRRCNPAEHSSISGTMASTPSSIAPSAREDDIADILVAECRSLGANLLVMGSYGHSGLHELLPSITTSRILRISPFPLLIAH